MVLIRRLPGITACDVLSNRAGRGFLITQRTNKPNTRRNVPGSRLFKETCGHTRAETNIAGSSGTLQSGSPPGAG
jgi:hypothetical protein